MPLHLHLTPDATTNIWIWEATESLEWLTKEVGESKTKQLTEGVKSQQRIRELLVTHLLLSLAHIEKLQHDSNGKPLCREYTSISISHSRQWIALATHTTSVIGIDLETNAPKVLKVARRFMSEEELSRLPVDNVPCMLACWCAKEAAYKIFGQPATDFRTALKIDTFTPQAEGRMMITLSVTPPQHLQVHYLHHPDYMLVYGTQD